MSLNILIVPDKFKGTLTARQAAEAIAEGWSRSRPQDKLELLPMSDGGDGFGEVMSLLLQGKVKSTATVDAAHRPRKAKWWWVARTKTAIIESAEVIGLALLPTGKYHPFQLDTCGLGAAFQAAARMGAVHCLAGIGGSATNDGGFGLARSLGWEFFDRKGRTITDWGNLVNLSDIRAPKRRTFFEDLVVASDVRNPLLGPTGATKVYGPQKGMKPTDYATAEAALRRLATVAKKELLPDCAKQPGAGAAGGLGFGLRCFLDARLEPGFELFADHANLSHRLRSVDLVITAEGAIDKSSLMGKGVGQIAELCRSMGIPCIGLAGVIKNPILARGHFTRVESIAPNLTSEVEAKRKPIYWLAKLAAEIGSALPSDSESRP